MPVVGKLSEDEVRLSAREMCSLIDVAHTKKIYDPIYKKYLRGKYLAVAQIPVMIRQNANQREKKLEQSKQQQVLVSSDIEMRRPSQWVVIMK